MKERFRKSGYRKTEIDGEFENGKKVNTGLADLAWQYIKSMTVDELDSNRQLFLDIWKPKEHRVVWCYTKLYPRRAVSVVKAIVL